MKRYMFVLLAVLTGSGSCSAQGHDVSSIGASDDCTQISVDFQDNPNLTSEEKTALMDQALRNSLNKYDHCHDEHARSAAVGGGAESGAGSGSGLGTGANGGGNAGQGASTASANMTGTNTPVAKNPAPDSLAGKPELAASKAAANQAKNPLVPANGKAPDDIPPADNDSVLEEQIRQAAINETDPVIQQKLWNEYRRYKGLPSVNKPQAQ